MQKVTIICKYCSKSFEVPSYYKDRYKTCGSKECKTKSRFDIAQNMGKANKGKKMSKESSIKKSLATKGRPQTLQHIQARTDTRFKNGWFKDPNIGKKISEAKKQGFQNLPEEEKEIKRAQARTAALKCTTHGRTKEYNKLTNDWKLITWRKQVKERDNFICQGCKKKDISKRLHAHHIKPILMHPDLKYNLDNGITLCPLCHKIAERLQTITA